MIKAGATEQNLLQNRTVQTKINQKRWPISLVGGTWALLLQIVEFNGQSGMCEALSKCYLCIRLAAPLSVQLPGFTHSHQQPAGWEEVGVVLIESAKHMFPGRGSGLKPGLI